MPKATSKQKSGTQVKSSSTSIPYSKSKPESKKSSSKTSRPKSNDNVKDPKQSHLYTDDNPSTTLHGTGFKDAETAERTLSLISKRSLTYQWQVVNTMYHRAKGHPSMKKKDGAVGIEAAMKVFGQWLEKTYPEAKEKRQQEEREFKPLLKREIVSRYLEQIEALEPTETEDANERGGTTDSKQFAAMYVELPKGKRLANILVDSEHPEEFDWEILREKALTAWRDGMKSKGEDGLWDKDGEVSNLHLRSIAWGWSPVPPKKLQ